MWKTFFPGSHLGNEVRGRYLQLLIELYPDGGGQLSPSVSSLSVFYEPDLPPHPPGWVVAEPGDEKITLRWNTSTDSDVSGYLLYYGEKPGQYFGSTSDSGASPIDIGNATSATLSGLKNGKLYYITVVSYDSSEPPHQSAFAREIAARPSSMHQRD